jgi:Carboxypeptidase regulatory-like domain
MKRLLLLLLLVLVSAAAQTESSLEGLVTDPSGAAIQGVALLIVETGTGTTRHLSTDGHGQYLATGLAPGSYTIQTEATGFRTSERKGVELGAGRTLQINFELPLSGIRESLAVEAATPLVSPSASDWGTTVNQARLEGLPLNGRDIFELAALEPGVSIPYTQQRLAAFGPAVHMSVNGARPTQNDYQVDGLYAGDATGSAAASSFGRTLGIEALREVRLVGSPFQAEYGRSAGGHFTAVSRSGANEFHGSLFEFMRNSAMDARNFFDTPTQPIPVLKRNQFGGLLSGPIVRHRLFVLFDYETVRAVSAATSIATTIDARARTGNLPSGSVSVSPAAAPFVALYPLPNGRLFGDGTGQFITTLTTRGPESYVTGKVDYNQSEKWHFNTRYTFDQGSSGVPDPFLLWNFNSDSQYDFLQLGAQFIASPATVEEFRAGFSRVDNLSAVSQTGIPAGLFFAPQEAMGAIAVTGLTDLGGQTFRSLPLRYVTNDYQTGWEVSHVSGRHGLKAGAGFERAQFNETSSQDQGGYYSFTSVASLISG